MAIMRNKLANYKNIKTTVIYNVTITSNKDTVVTVGIVSYRGNKKGLLWEVIIMKMQSQLWNIKSQLQEMKSQYWHVKLQLWKRYEK